MPLNTTNIFAMYQLFVEDTAKLSDRRQAMNTIYLSVNSVLLGSVALLAQLGGLNNPYFLIAEVVVAAGGTFIAWRWRNLLTKYQRLGKLRFKVLRDIERLCDLPSEAQMYALEDKSGLYGFTDMEKSLPTMFQLLYIVATIFIAVGVLIQHPHFVARVLQLLPLGH